ncbi:MAG: S-adenosylmethionine decarboxylase [Candidatus Omnitrophica bacterium]|nr:S-adenosylmethionine decarboxylase [Candidatus Omnitrophota bacterium]
MPAGHEKTKQKAFGYELLLDLYNCKKGVCDNLLLCYRFLDDIVIHLGMEKQSPPSIFFTDAKRFPDKAGLSGWVPLVESSIVIHTLSLKNFITIDIYCCRDFDEQSALDFCKRYFLPDRVETQFLYRGIDYYVKRSAQAKPADQALIGIS